MTLDVIHQRLHNQLLSQPNYTEPSQVVEWLGAVQAQDYAGAKWALAQRMKEATDAAIEADFSEGKILRTHVMRPTWHFVTPAHIRWMLELTASRVRSAIAHMDRQLEVDGTLIKKSHKILRKALQGKRQLTRAELSPILQKAGISPEGLRLGHLLMHAELDAVVCSGARKGKQFTYALLEERAPEAKSLGRNEALAELARRYYRSHGPATIQDFVWWSGLTTTDARAGVEAVKSEFESEIVNKETYWFPSVASETNAGPAAYLLSNYDEYTVGYKDRRAIYDGSHDDKLSAFRESILTQVMVLDGRVSGTWKRILKKNEVIVELAPFTVPKKIQNRALIAAAQRYGRFLELPVVLA